MLRLFLLFSSAQLAISQSISPITPKGSKLYDNKGNQFFAKGVAYSPGAASTVDALSLSDQCQVDAGMMKTLGANTVHVYDVDPTLNHDGCMQAFASQGIYVWLDMSTPTSGFNRADPGWSLGLFNHYAAVIDAFAKYDNLLVFGVGNEVITDLNSTASAPYIKAAARDVKAYRDARGYRKIPVGYSAADNADIRRAEADYLACGDAQDSIDIYGMNIYSWCGNSSYTISGYDKLYEEFQQFNLPVLFTETGCNVGTRDFSDAATMLGPIFQAVFSGAIVYEWLEEASNYGLVNYSNADATGFPTTLSDFNALSTVFSTVNPTGTPKASYTPSNSIPACPTSDSTWSVANNFALPTISNLHLDQVTAVTTYTTPGDSGSSATSHAAASSSTGSSSHTSSTGDAKNSSSGLSTAARTGVAVGVVGIVIGVLAVAICVYFILRRRKRQSNNRIALEPEGSDDSFQKPELPAQSVKPVVPRAELDSGGLWAWRRKRRSLVSAELDSSQHATARGDGTIHELQHNEQKGPLVELDAS